MINNIVTPEGLAMPITREKANFNVSETVFNKGSLPEKSNARFRALIRAVIVLLLRLRKGFQ